MVADLAFAGLPGELANQTQNRFAHATKWLASSSTDIPPSEGSPNITMLLLRMALG